MKKLMMISGAMWLAVAFFPACRSAHESSLVKDTTTGAEVWCHEVRQSGDMTIKFDYQFDYTGSGPSSSHVLAKPAWFNVTKPYFNGSEGVQISIDTVLYSYPHGAENYAFDRQNQVLTLHWDDQSKKFTAEVPNGLLIDESQPGSDNSTRAYYDIAVVANGEWYKDSNGQNIKIKPKFSNYDCQ